MTTAATRNQIVTTTDAIRNAARAIDAEAAKLAGYEPSVLARELLGLATFLSLTAGDEANGNMSCSITVLI